MINIMNHIKEKLTQIFEILYQQNHMVLAGLIQEMYFQLDEELDDEDYEYESDTDSDDYYPDYISDEEYQVDEHGFFQLT